MIITYLSQSTFPSPTVDSIQVTRQCAAFVRAGHEVNILAPDKKGLLVESAQPADYYGQCETIELTKLPYVDPAGSRLRYLYSTWSFMRQIKRQLEALRPDLAYGRYLPGCVVAAKLGIPTIFEAHRPITLSLLENALFRRTAPQSAFLGVTTISGSLKSMYEALPELVGKIVLAEHDAAEHPPETPPLEEWPGKTGHLQVGYAGSLFPGRGVELIEQLANRLPNMDFHLIGGEPDDLAAWKAKACPSNMLFHGYVSPSEIHKHRAACDVLLAPYQRKVTVRGQTDTSAYMSPMKIFEYMASSRPMVVSDLPVLREVLSPEIALLVEPDDIDGWEQALHSLEDGDTRKRYAAAALARFQSRHTWDTRAASILAGFHLAG